MTTPPVSLDALRAFMNLSFDDTEEDDELAAMLEAATDLVEARVGPMVTQSRTRTVYGRNGMVVLPTPVLSVESLSFDGGDPFDLAGLDVDLDAGVVSARYGYALATWWWETPNVSQRPFQITYTAGRGDAADIPQPLKQATMIVAEQLWKTQRGTGSRLPGGSTEQVYLGFVWPARAVQAVEPYIQFAFA